MTKKKTPKPAKTAPKPVNNYQSEFVSYGKARFTIYKDDEILMQYVADGPQEAYRLRTEGCVSRDEYLAATRAPAPTAEPIPQVSRKTCGGTGSAGLDAEGDTILCPGCPDCNPPEGE